MSDVPQYVVCSIGAYDYGYNKKDAQDSKSQASLDGKNAMR